MISYPVNSFLMMVPSTLASLARFQVVLFSAWIDAAPNDNASAVPASYGIQSASSLRSRKKFTTLSNRSTGRRRSFTMRTRSDAAQVTSDDMQVIDLERDCE